MMSLDSMEKKGMALWNWVRTARTKSREEKLERLKKDEFLKEIERARCDLDAARSNYNFATEAGLLDYYIYEIKAAETRLNHYVKLAKKENLTNDLFFGGLFSENMKRKEELL